MGAAFVGRRRGSAVSLIVGLAAIALAFAGSSTALAGHSWGSYHWQRSANPVDLHIVDSVAGGTWDTHLRREVVPDWSGSSVLSLTVEQGAETPWTRRRCPMASGKIRVCNYAYGFNGWLGIASIQVSGGHIVQATTRLNDSYHDRAPHNSQAWRRSVMCQEIGHTFGLDHQSEDPAVNAGTCMDYHEVPNLSPNAHDFQQLATIYTHLDQSSASAPKPRKRKGGLGLLGSLTRVTDDLWIQNLRGGGRIFHFVNWATPGRHGAPRLI